MGSIRSGDYFNERRYLLKRQLGQSTVGEVWLAVDTHRGQEVALKLILNRDRPAAWHEAKVLTALQSPHILQVNNADVALDIPYLDTALAQCSLDKLSEPSGAEPTQATDWLRRALRGLNLCHSRRLLHRDVKPQNLFLSLNGDAQLPSLTVARLLDGRGGFRPPCSDFAHVRPCAQSAREMLRSPVAASVPFFAVTRMSFGVCAGG